MNYTHYELKIVESLGVALVGWPVPGRIRNPGDLTVDQVAILRSALFSRECKWISLSDHQVAARKASNTERFGNGEDVYGPPRKKRARKVAQAKGDGTEGDGMEM
jgi:hypothetical protein